MPMIYRILILYRKSQLVFRYALKFIGLTKDTLFIIKRMLRYRDRLDLNQSLQSVPWPALS